jgi:hypothetical protein
VRDPIASVRTTAALPSTYPKPAGAVTTTAIACCSTVVTFSSDNVKATTSPIDASRRSASADRRMID